MRISDWSSDVCSSDLQGRDEDDAVERHQIEKALQYRLRLIGVARGNAFDHQMMFGRAAGLEQDQDDVRSIARHAAIPIRRIAVLGLQTGKAACRERVWHYV